MSRKSCESCGMPMDKKEMFGGGREDNHYCVYCSDTEGNLKSYDEVLTGMKNFVIKTMGLSEAEAEKTAKENMGKMPAWMNR